MNTRSVFFSRGLPRILFALVFGLLLCPALSPPALAQDVVINTNVGGGTATARLRTA